METCSPCDGLRKACMLSHHTCYRAADLYCSRTVSPSSSGFILHMPSYLRSSNFINSLSELSLLFRLVQLTVRPKVPVCVSKWTPCNLRVGYS